MKIVWGLNGCFSESVGTGRRQTVRNHSYQANIHTQSPEGDPHTLIRDDTIPQHSDGWKFHKTGPYSHGDTCTWNCPVALRTWKCPSDHTGGKCSLWPAWSSHVLWILCEMGWKRWLMWTGFNGDTSALVIQLSCLSKNCCQMLLHAFTSFRSGINRHKTQILYNGSQLTYNRKKKRSRMQVTLLTKSHSKFNSTQLCSTQTEYFVFLGPWLFKNKRIHHANKRNEVNPIKLNLTSKTVYTKIEICGIGTVFQLVAICNRSVLSDYSWCQCMGRPYPEMCNQCQPWNSSYLGEAADKKHNNTSDAEVTTQEHVLSSKFQSSGM